MPVAQSFAYGTVAAYALLAVLWGAILVLYLRYRRAARAEDPLIALLLAVLALDAFKSLIESVYFGIVWTANYGIGFAALREPLSHPVPLTLTKVLNVFVAATVLTVLVRRWLPAELAQRRAQRGAALTRQLLVYAGKQETSPEPLDLGRLVADIGELLRVSIPRSIELVVTVEPDLPEVRGEAAQLQQVVLNLLTNAADAIGAGNGSIAVSVTGRRLGRDELDGFRGDRLPAGEYVVLEVADTGCGMDEATRERIFDPFFSTKGSGRGLGLAALAGILRAHAAGVAIDTAPGRGTRFRIALPALARRARTGHTPALRMLPRGAGVALVVGDDGPARQQLTQLLTDVGFEVVDAADVAEALEAAASVGAALALAVVDWDLPDGTGLKLARLLHQGAPTLPQLLTSDTDLVERRTAAAPALLLTKPIRSDDLFAALVRLGFTT
ncbi:MAG: response regulator [Thermoanaerobaculia bacterium]|nr:response regulator [Thermoanaerobaculia bacterium]